MNKLLILIRPKSKHLSEELICSLRDKAWRISFSVEELQDSISVRRKYPQGFPAHAIILLSEKLRDGCSEKIFPFFTQDNKGMTLVQYWSDDFKKKAEKSGFWHLSHIVIRSGERTTADVLAAALRRNKEEYQRIMNQNLDSCGS